MGKALLGDSHVALDLPVQQLLYVGDIHRLGEVVDVRHGQQRAVGEAALVVGLHGQVQKNFPVALHADNVGVVVGNADLGCALPLCQGNLDVKDQVAVQELHPDGVVLQIGAHLLLLLRRHLGDNLQQQLRLSGHYPGGGRRLDAVEPAGVGHHYALHVFDDVAAGLHHHLVGQFAQQLPGLGRAVGDGDGLGAPHGGHQLLLQNLEVGVVLYIRLVHFAPPLQCLHYTGKTARGQTLAADCVLWYDKKAARGRIPMRPQKCKRFDRRKSDVQSGMFRF